MAGVEINTEYWPMLLVKFDGAQVQKVAQWMKATADETRKWCVGNGIVSRSLGFRFLLSSIFLVKPMPCPYQVCASFDEAMTWVRGVASAKGLDVPLVPNLWNV